MKPLIVIPTYNERRNVRRLIPRILGILPGAEVLVVDDASPDGTARAVRRLARRFRGRVHLVRRKGKGGLGSAYVAGFEWALAGGRHDAVVEMDADGSHDPEALPGLLDGLRGGRDGAVGTRYRDGLRVINWPWSRVWLSVMANAYARVVTGVPMSDLTGGYNAWRTRLLGRIRPATLTSNGYAFQIELKTRAFLAGASIREVPIVFSGRVEGESKLSRSVVWEALWAVWRFRMIRGGRRGRVS